MHRGHGGVAGRGGPRPLPHRARAAALHDHALPHYWFGDELQPNAGIVVYHDVNAAELVSFSRRRRRRARTGPGAGGRCPTSKESGRPIVSFRNGLGLPPAGASVPARDLYPRSTVPSSRAGSLPRLAVIAAPIPRESAGGQRHGTKEVAQAVRLDSQPVLVDDAIFHDPLHVLAGLPVRHELHPELRLEALTGREPSYRPVRPRVVRRAREAGLPCTRSRTWRR